MLGVVLYVVVDWLSVDVMICKGGDLCVDFYSVFQENYGLGGMCLFIGLVGWLCECCVEVVYFCGLVCDVCVLWSVQDVVWLGFCIYVLWDLC